MRKRGADAVTDSDRPVPEDGQDGPLGVGVVSYAMIQTTPDSGSGARLGSFESRVYGVGPIVSFTTSADPSKALTVLAKWYSEFDAEHTFAAR